MTSEDHDGFHKKRRRPQAAEVRPYVLKPLLQNIRLASEDVDDDVHINCVEYWSAYVSDGADVSADTVSIQMTTFT